MAFDRCPITTQLIVELVKNLKSSSLHDDLVEEIEEVQELAEGSKPDEDALTLRAFYLLEVMYHILLPKMITPRYSTSVRERDSLRRSQKETHTLGALAQGGELIQQVRGWRFPRSREGLTELLGILTEMSDDVEVESYAMAMDGRVDKSIRAVRHTQSLPLHGLLLLIIPFATELRKAMNPNGQVRWPYFGTNFSSAWSVTNQDESELLEHASRLTRIYPNATLAPWNLTKNYQD